MQLDCAAEAVVVGARELVDEGAPLVELEGGEPAHALRTHQRLVFVTVHLGEDLQKEDPERKRGRKRKGERGEREKEKERKIGR